MIEILNVTKVYKSRGTKVTGVDDVSLTIDRGTIFGIIGYSGAGKSSLLRCINLLEQPTSGDIKINDVAITKLKGEALRQARLKIGMIFQHFYLIQQKTVYENIAFALRAAKFPENQIKQRVHELLAMVELQDKSEAFPAQLSGGQKQRVAIARAIANNPEVLLSDEATSALDPQTTVAILNLLQKINRELGITIVLITHEMQVVKEICHRMAIMQDGKVIEEGTVYDLFAHPKEPLTKHFISNVVSFDIPPHIVEKCTGTLVKLLFKGETAGEGIISDALQQFKLQGNFIHGAIEYIGERPLGTFIMEVNGDEATITQALAYIASRDVEVEVL